MVLDEGPAQPSAAVGPRLRRWQIWQKFPLERLIAFFLFLCAAVSILTTVGIVAVLTYEAARCFADVSFLKFITGTEWTPLFATKQFGVLARVAGTVQTAIGAMIVALPLGLLSAIYLSEYAPGRARRIIKPILEILAGIPTIVYGFFALLFITPILKDIHGGISVFNGLSASIVMGIMITPMVSSLSEDAMRAVPRPLREGAYALGATKLEVSTRVVIPAALSGIVASFILAMSRAIGETMIVTIAAGQNPNFTLNPLVPIETMTAFIVQVSQGDLPTGTLEFKTIFAVALTLFVFTLAINMLSQYFVRRFREAYQ